MAKEQVTLEVEIEADGRSLGQMRDELEKLTQELESVPVGSEAFNKLSAEVAQAGREIKNLELGFESLDNEQVASELGSVAGAVGDVTTGLFLLGGENENLEELAQNIETALGVSMALKGAIEGVSSAQKLWTSFVSKFTVVQKIATTATKVFQAVTKSTLGILAVFVTVVGGIVAAIRSFSGEVSAADQAQEQLNKALQEGNKAVGEQTTRINTLTAVIKDNTTSQRDRNEAITELNELLPDSIGLITKETIATGELNAAIQDHLEQIKLRAEAKALENSLTVLFTENLNAELAIQQLGDTQYEQITKRQFEEDIALRNEQIKLLQAESVEREQLIKDEQASVAIKTKSVEVTVDKIKAEKKSLDVTKEVVEEEDTLAQERLDRELELRQAIEDAENEFTDSLLTEQQRQENAVRDKYFNLIEQAKEFGIDTMELEIAQQVELKRIRDEFDALELEAELEKERLERERKEAQKAKDKADEEERRAEIQATAKLTIDTAQEVLNVITAIDGLSQKRDLKRIKEKIKNGEELTKAEAKRLDNEEKKQRAFAVAQLTIDTARAISSGVASAAAVPFPGNIPAILATVAAVLTNVGTAAKLLSEPLPSAGVEGGGSGSPDLSGGGEDTPQLDPVQAGSTFLNQEPTQVVVLESDITNTQNNVAVIESQATFGG